MPTEMVLKTIVVQGGARVGNAETEGCEAASTSRLRRRMKTLVQDAVSVNGHHWYSSVTKTMSSLLLEYGIHTYHFGPNVDRHIYGILNEPGGQPRKNEKPIFEFRNFAILDYPSFFFSLYQNIFNNFTTLKYYLLNNVLLL